LIKNHLGIEAKCHILVPNGLQAVKSRCQAPQDLDSATMDHPVSEIMIPAWVDNVLTPVEKIAAHEQGLRHLAVSVFVLRGDSVLIQQRAWGKYHTPGLWANTCCTHPAWEEPPQSCAHRRLNEELGITGIKLSHRGQVEYRADVGGGMIEHELVEVFVGHADHDMPLDANPDEVVAVEWIPLPDLRDQIARAPQKFTPWLRIYLEHHATAIFGADETQEGRPKATL